MQEKRTRPRLKVSMPVQVIGYTIDGEKFREVCQTYDASAFGLCLILKSIVSRGTILFLSMQMPRRLRLYDLSTEIYQIYAQIQRVHMLAEGGCEIGLSFIGKTPPPGAENYQTMEFLNIELQKTNTSSRVPGELYVQATNGNYLQNPSKSINPSPEISSIKTEINDSEINSDSVTDNNSNNNASLWERPGRRDARLTIPIEVMIDFLDSSGKVVYQEPGLVTNISRSGACVMATKEAPIGSKVNLNMTRENFAAISCIKAVTSGQGGVWNLHLEFLDKCWMGGS